MQPTTPVAKTGIICYFTSFCKMFHFIGAKNSFSLLETCKYHSFIKAPPDGNLITVDSDSRCLELCKNFENSCLFLTVRIRFCTPAPGMEPSCFNAKAVPPSRDQGARGWRTGGLFGSQSVGLLAQRKFAWQNCF